MFSNLPPKLRDKWADGLGPDDIDIGDICIGDICNICFICDIRVIFDICRSRAIASNAPLIVVGTFEGDGGVDDVSKVPNADESADKAFMPSLR